MKRSAGQVGQLSRLWALLAFLALTMNVLIPPGFMVGPAAAATGLVICTGHGPASLPTSGPPKGQPVGKAGHDGGACPFAGHGAASAPPPMSMVASAIFVPGPTSPAQSHDQAPGRGLAAPPPPSRGPPLLI